MTESGTPLAAAVEAAPILKLWPEYLEQSIPARVRYPLNVDVKLLFVRGLESWKRNKRPGVGPQMIR